MPTPSQMAPKEAANPNPFATIQNFEHLDEVLSINGKGLSLQQVAFPVASYMQARGLASAVVTCSGHAGKSRKHFVNLELLKKTNYEVFKNVSSLHPLVHMEVPDNPHIVILKAAALNKSA